MNEEAVMTKTNRQSRIALIALGGVVLVLVVVAAVLGARQDVAQLEPGSPEAVVQSYVMAVFDRDEPAAASYLSPTLLQECQDRDFLVYETSAVRIELDDVSVTDGEARVEVTIHESSEPLDDWQHTELFYLTDTADGWKISRSPWPLFGC